MQNALSGLTSNLSEILVYVAIGLITLIGFVKCVYPVFRNTVLLNRAVARLEKNTAEGGNPSVWREQKFLGRSLSGNWQQFLMNANQLGLRGISCNTQDYINDETVIEKPGHAALAELIPGLLTSLGILGTFMGLMQGLTSVDFTTAEGTITSIPELLSGMRFAFATSVVGITCSLAFNIINRMVIGKANRALDEFEEAFYDLAMPRPLETDVQMILQKQDQNNIYLQMADLIGNRMSAGIEMAVGRAMAPLTQSLDHFIKGATHDQEESLRRIVNQFVQQMNQSLNGQLAALGEALQAATETQSRTQSDLDTTLECIQTMTGNAKEMTAAGENIAKDMQQLSFELQSIAAQQDQLAQDSQNAHQMLDDRIEALNDSLARLQIALDLATAEISGDKKTKTH